MKITRNLIALTIALSGNFALGQEVDSTNLFIALSDAGVSWEQSMGSSYVGVTDLWCSRENSYSGYTCEMIDAGIEAEGKKIVVSGEQADAILAALPTESPFDPYGKFELGVAGITCKRSNEVLIDIEVGEVATCTIEVGAE